MRIALIQLHSDIGTDLKDPRDSNLERLISTLELSPPGSIDLALTGEMYLSGYRSDQHQVQFASSGDLSEDSRLNSLVDHCDRYSRTLILGLPIGSGDRIYNAAAVIDGGGVRCVYRKCALASMFNGLEVVHEGSFFARGEESLVIEIDGTKIGIQICYDIVLPELSRSQVLEGADLIVNLAAAPKRREPFWRSMMYTRAYENKVWYVMASIVGAQKDSSFAGPSRIVSPSGKTVCSAKSNQEGVTIAAIDVAEAKRERVRSRIMDLRNPTMYGSLSKGLVYP